MKAIRPVFRRLLIVIPVLEALLLSGCGKTPTENIAEEATEYIGTDTDEDELLLEEKDRSSFDFSVHQIEFSVPEGLYSSGIVEDDDEYYIFETFYDEKMYETYTVCVSKLIYYDTLEDYTRSIISDVRTTFTKSADIKIEEEVVDGNRVSYVTVSYLRQNYEGEDSLVWRIYAGVLLPDNTVFEVESMIIDYEDELGFDKIRPFFENLRVTNK